jgi:hypothetical protein
MQGILFGRKFHFRKFRLTFEYDGSTLLADERKRTSEIARSDSVEDQARTLGSEDGGRLGMHPDLRLHVEAIRECPEVDYGAADGRNLRMVKR